VAVTFNIPDILLEQPELEGMHILEIGKRAGVDEECHGHLTAFFVAK
jgi:hypothetical protein